MIQVKAQEGQSLLDIAIAHCGDVEAAFEIMQANDLPLSAKLEVGQIILIPNSYKSQITDFYVNNEISPATAELENSEGGGFYDNHHTSNLVTNYLKHKIVSNNE